MEEPTRFTTNSSGVSKQVNAPEQIVNTARLEFDVGAIKKLTTGRGAKVIWEESWLCTCRNPKTLAPDPLCPMCNGKGVAYLPGVPTKVTFQSQEKGAKNSEFGMYDSGTAIATTQMESMLGYRDRLTLPDIKVRQALIFDLTEERVENGMYLQYDVREIEFIRGKGGKVLVEGKDYTLNKAINRLYVSADNIGTNISVNLFVTLRYYVIDILKDARYQYTELNRGKDNALFENLPKKALVKREDTFVSPEAFSMTLDTSDKVKELLGDNGNSQEAPPSVSTGVKLTNIGKTGGFFGGALP